MLLLKMSVMSMLALSLPATATPTPPQTPADHDFYKTICLWNDTGETVNVQLQWDDLDPYTPTLQPGSWTSYSWFQQEGTVNTPPLHLWFPSAPSVSLDTSATPSATLVPLNTEQERDCQKLRSVALHYVIHESFDASGKVTSFSLAGPMANP